MLLGIGIAVVTAAAGLFVGIFESSLGTALLVLAVCVPLLVLQDLGRYLGIATQRPARALVLDTVWLVLQIVAVAMLFVADARTLGWFIAAWAGSGALSGVLLFFQYTDYRLRLSLTWLRYTWSFSWRYLISYSSTQSTALAASGAVGAFAGSKALGGVQGTILLVRPFGTVQVAAVAAGVSEISRSNGSRSRIRRRALQITGFATGLAIANAVVMLVLPDRVGELILGATWHTAKPLLLPTGVQIVFLGALTGARAGLLGMRAIRRAVVIDVASTAVVLVATFSGVLIDDALGALWAVAIGQAILATTWWGVFINQLSRHDPITEADQDFPTPTLEGPLPTTSIPMA
jgi:O-antigen/teichoic acid export membrane protein